MEIHISSEKLSYCVCVCIVKWIGCSNIVALFPVYIYGIAVKTINIEYIKCHGIQIKNSDINDLIGTKIQCESKNMPKSQHKSIY